MQNALLTETAIFRYAKSIIVIHDEYDKIYVSNKSLKQDVQKSVNIFNVLSL